MTTPHWIAIKRMHMKGRKYIIGGVTLHYTEQDIAKLYPAACGWKKIGTATTSRNVKEAQSIGATHLVCDLNTNTWFVLKKDML